VDLVVESEILAVNVVKDVRLDLCPGVRIEPLQMPESVTG
jgi:hypothetical protein